MPLSRRLVNSVASLANDTVVPPKPIAEIAAAKRRIDESTRQREAADVSMRSNEAESRAMFETMSHALIFADAQRCIRRVNPAFDTTFGYSAEEVVGRTTEFLYADPDDYAAQGRLRFQPGVAKMNAPSELCYRRKDAPLRRAGNSAAMRCMDLPIRTGSCEATHCDKSSPCNLHKRYAS